MNGQRPAQTSVVWRREMHKTERILTSSSLFTSTLVSRTHLHLFPTTVCPLILRPTSPTFLLFTLLPVSFAHLVTPVVHLSVQYPMVKGLSHTPPLLLGSWNSLPRQVRSSDSVSTFRSRTKTHLFHLAY